MWITLDLFPTVYYLTMAPMRVFCLVFIFIPLAKQDSIQTALSAVIGSMDKLMEFYTANYRDFNIDGIFGLRVIEGQVGLILDEYASGRLKHIPKDVMGHLQKLKRTASEICRKATEYVKRDDQQYFNTMSFVISAPWTFFDKTRRKVDERLKWEPAVYQNVKNAGTRLDEETSDKCMSELTGSLRPDHKRCQLSDHCINLMTTKGLVGYGITHQILWTMLADKAGCLPTMDQEFQSHHKGTVESVRHDLCSNNYIQLHKTLARFPEGQILPHYQDLFLEILFICPSLGYSEFLTNDFIHQTLTWQHASGCFGKMRRPHGIGNIETELIKNNVDYEYEEDFPQPHESHQPRIAPHHIVQEMDLADSTDNEKSKLYNQINMQRLNRLKAPDHQDIHEMHQSDDQQGPGQPQALGAHPGAVHFQNIPDHAIPGSGRKLLVKDSQYGAEGSQKIGRHLLAEKDMADGCLAHKTAVAGGALALILRYLLEPDASVTFGLPDIANKQIQIKDNTAGVSIFDQANVGGQTIEVNDKSILNGKKPAHAGGDLEAGPTDDYTSPDQPHEIIANTKFNRKLKERLENKRDHQKSDVNGDPDGNDDDGYNDGDDDDDGDYNEEEEEREKGEAYFYGDHNAKNHPPNPDHVPPNFPAHAIVNKIHNPKLDGQYGDKEDLDNLGDDDEGDTYYEKRTNEKRRANQKKNRGDIHVYADSNHHKHPSFNKRDTALDQEPTLGDLAAKSVSTRTVVIIFSVCFAVLLMLMYRFIKKRRIHIRYSPRSYRI